MTDNRNFLSLPAIAVEAYLKGITAKEDEAGTKYRAEISSLRNSVNRSVAQDIQLFKKVTTILSRYGYHEDNDSFVTDKEEAVGAALTLFSSHYGTKVRKPYNEERRFGKALAEIQHELRKGQPENSLIVEKLNFILKANTLPEYRRHIKSILDFAKNDKSSFDYGVFTQDLINIQNPSRKDGVLRKWVRDFYNHLDFLETPANTAPKAQK